MSRRVSLPAADDLFRPTSPDPAPVEDEDAPQSPASTAQRPAAGEAPAVDGRGRPSGRVRHDEKMTVYVTPEELLDLEHARLTVRRLGLAVDRGRLVREAVAIALADIDSRGEDSLIVQRLLQP